MMDFVIKHGLSILEIVVSLVCLIIYILKKNKVILKDTAFEKLLSKLPSIILSAERSIKDGSSKKSFVLSVSYALLADLTGEDVEVVAVKYGDRISSAIEQILETPQKKEV